MNAVRTTGPWVWQRSVVAGTVLRRGVVLGLFNWQSRTRYGWSVGSRSIYHTIEIDARVLELLEWWKTQTLWKKKTGRQAYSVVLSFSLCFFAVQDVAKPVPTHPNVDPSAHARDLHPAVDLIMVMIMAMMMRIRCVRNGYRITSRGVHGESRSGIRRALLFLMIPFKQRLLYSKRRKKNIESKQKEIFWNDVLLLCSATLPWAGAEHYRCWIFQVCCCGCFACCQWVKMWMPHVVNEIGREILRGQELCAIEVICSLRWEVLSLVGSFVTVYLLSCWRKRNYSKTLLQEILKGHGNMCFVTKVSCMANTAKPTKSFLLTCHIL